MNDKELKDYATEANPLRCSGVQRAVVCSWRGVMQYLDMERDESGPAADVGSAMHAAIYQWHQTKGDVKSALQHMDEMIKSKFRLADTEGGRLEAVEMFLGYCKDPRNPVDCLTLNEQQMRIAIAPAPHDKTGKEIIIQGTTDQVRFHKQRGVYLSYDLKSSKLGGEELKNDHYFQQHLYAFAAGLKLGAPVLPGAIIRTRAYLTQRARKEPSPMDVFHYYNSGRFEMLMVLESIQNHVAEVRAGRIQIIPSNHCPWCPAHGTEFCNAHAKQHIDLPEISARLI